ncbi:hypothetical protein MACH17_08660 [Phaeobacter inhibens]|uniref:hypothetical protein n=1 Tax=Phaeobacter inhibens TaxID=221822 RepID=UPI002744B2D8|nr:hypothetical protein [Phaeobacter inhibens]GLO69349.1 hypothetical protein MACH17_08660 [Phaeobacter inhibens]
MAGIGILVGVIGGLNAGILGYTLIGLSFGMSLLLYPLFGVASAMLAILLLWMQKTARETLGREVLDDLGQAAHPEFAGKPARA